jgi:hypothetical protein
MKNEALADVPMKNSKGAIDMHVPYTSQFIAHVIGQEENDVMNRFEVERLVKGFNASATAQHVALLTASKQVIAPDSPRTPLDLRPCRSLAEVKGGML